MTQLSRRLFVFSGLLGALAATAPAPALAKRAANAQPRPEDFAYGMPIRSESPGPVLAVSLPEAVYRGVTLPDLGDLRVFNGAGELVPFELETPRATETESREEKALPVFPIAGTPGATGGAQAVRIREDGHGRVTEVTFADAGGRAATGDGRAFLVDLRGAGGSVRSLELRWSAADPSAVHRLAVEAGDDLASWRDLGVSASVARLSFGGQALEENRVELPWVSAKFLKITAPDGRGFRIEGVRAAVTRGERREVARAWRRVEGKAAADSRGEALFESGGFFPVELVRVLLPEPNTVLKVRLSSRPDRAGADWVTRYTGTVYRIAGPSGELASAPIPLPAIRDRAWKLSLEGRDSAFGTRLPDLELGWAPQQLLLLARGKAPFQLAYGSARWKAADFGFSSILQTLGAGQGAEAVKPQPATLGEASTLGGEARLQPDPPSKEIPLRSIGVWVALGAVVLLLGGMALKLIKDLNRPSGPAA